MICEDSRRLEKNRQSERICKCDNRTEPRCYKEGVWRTLFGRKVSPEFPTESKAGSFAMDWMNKHPRGIE
jgi:hypothetical protein